MYSTTPTWRVLQFVVLEILRRRFARMRAKSRVIVRLKA